MEKDFKNATVNSFIQNAPEKVLEAHVIKATIVQDSNESSDSDEEYDNELDEYDNENEEAEASEKSAEPEQLEVESTKEKTSFDDKQVEVVDIDSFEEINEVSDKSMRGIIDESYLTYKSILDTMSLSMVSANNPM
jgi:hypothetical protein